MLDNDDRSVLNRYLYKKSLVREIHEDGGHREQEESLRDELNRLWDQMSEDEKEVARKEHQKEPQERTPYPEPTIQEVPVKNLPTKTPTGSILWPEPIKKREPVKSN